jgi:hypothetical protein
MINETENCEEEFRFPKEIYNRPGLDHIRYRIGRYSEFRKYLLKGLYQSVELANWTHHSHDDPAFALLEGACVLGDILTFYQELYANEAYIRTAIEGESIADLVALLGYQLSPGLTGSATFNIEVKGNKPVTIPANLPIKAEIEGIDQPVTFETNEESVCYPYLNKFHMYSPFFYPETDSLICESTTQFYLDNLATNPKEQPEIKSGDRILIGEMSPINPRRIINVEIIIVDSVHQIRGRTVFTIKGKLKRTNCSSSVVGYKIENAYRHFGHNAPKTIANVASDGNNNLIDIENKREFPLESEVQDMAIGTTVLVQGFFVPTNWPTHANRRTLTLVRQVTNVRPSSATHGSFSGSTSFITLDTQLATKISPTYFSTIDISRIQFFEVTGPQFILRSPGKLLSDQKGSLFYLYGMDKNTVAKLKGRRLTIVTKNKEPVMATVISSSSSPSPSPLPEPDSSLQLDKELEYIDFPNEEPTTQVFGNPVVANQGESQEEILEAGDERQEFQTFKLSNSPLTYFISSNDTPPEVPKLQVYVENRLWKQVPTFFDKESDDQIYVVRQDRNANSWIQFGDGKTGRRLPTGLGNILARYKIGSGATGKLKSDTTVKALDKTELIEEINLYDEVSGGTPPEQPERSKEKAPGKTLSLGRMVSLKDYESEALSIDGVMKASADLIIRNVSPTIVVVLITESNSQVISKNVEKVLIDYDRCRGMQRYPFEIIMASFKFIYIEADYGIDPTHRKEIVEQQIQDALGLFREGGKERERGRQNANVQTDHSDGLFAVSQRRFGQSEYATTVEGAIQNVDGVIWAKVKSMCSLGLADNPENLVIPNTPEYNPSIACDDRTQILRLYHKHLKLNDLSEKTLGKKCI